jgi:hypothetical protein
MEENAKPAWLRALRHLAVLAVALPLVVACGDDEVAQEETMDAPAQDDGMAEAPVGGPTVGAPPGDPAAGEPGAAIEDTLDRTGEAIEAVPGPPPAAQ